MKYPAFYVYCSDKDRIQMHRSAHREYVGKLRGEGKIVMAGPFSDDSGALIVYEADSIEGARALIESDPFNRNGVFESYQMKEWNQLF